MARFDVTEYLVTSKSVHVETQNPQAAFSGPVSLEVAGGRHYQACQIREGPAIKGSSSNVDVALTWNADKQKPPRGAVRMCLILL
jgi:hypothetical protein